MCIYSHIITIKYVYIHTHHYTSRSPSGLSLFSILCDMFLIIAYSFHSIIYSITDMLTSHDLDVGNSTLLGAFLTQRNGWLDHCRHVEASHGTPKNDLGNDSSIGYLMFVSFRSKFLGLQPLLLLLLFSFLAIHCCTAT